MAINYKLSFQLVDRMSINSEAATTLGPNISVSFQSNLSHNAKRGKCRDVDESSFAPPRAKFENHPLNICLKFRPAETSTNVLDERKKRKIMREQRECVKKARKAGMICI